jgi:hypothetical protein
MTARPQPWRRSGRTCAPLRTAASSAIKAGDYLPAALARHSRDLLAAVEAALKLADEALPVDRDYGGEPIWWNLTPDEIREAITREITGTPETRSTADRTTQED